MEPEAPAIPNVEAAGCPFIHLVDGKWGYHTLGCCTGLPHGLLMIPTVEEYRSRCCTAAHVLCPVYRSRHGQDTLEAWLQAEQEPWALRPLDWPCGASLSAPVGAPASP
jgi:hypothetical protein